MGVSGYPTMPHSPIDTFLFDLGNVLINWDPRHVYRTLFASEEEMERFLSEICNHDWNVQMDGGRSFADGIAELVARYPEQAPLIRAYRERWPEMLGGPIGETVDVLARLQSDGRRLFALTNWSSDTFPIARAQYGFLDWFEHIVVSGEVKLVKPDPAIFRHAIERCSLDPARTLFIDDSRVNVESAARMGFATHHFTAPGPLRATLSEWGLLA